jgi:hypothetical protein
VNAVDLVRTINDGKGRITMKTREGKIISADLCDALKQIFSYLVFKDMEHIRKLYKEGKIKSSSNQIQSRLKTGYIIERHKDP